MKVLYPLIPGFAGGDVYFERLCSSVNELDISAELIYYPSCFQFFPSAAKFMPGKLWDCDIVHTNAEYAFAFQNSKPLISTVHHLVFDPSYQKYTSLRQKAFHKLLFRNTQKSLQVSDCIVAVSQSTKRDISKHFEVDDVEVIYNGIDVEQFRPIEVQDDRFNDKIKLLFVGNLTVRKGADLLPKIMRKLEEKYVLLYTSGLRTHEGFTGYSNMVPLGKLSTSALINAYNLCDMLIAPTRLEGFGYSIAEAMACAKPVVATDTSSVPELLHNEKGGFLVEMDDVNSFVEKIEILGQDRSAREAMGNYNREIVVRKFDIKLMSDKYVRLYQLL